MAPELEIAVASTLITWTGGAIGIWYALRKGTDDAKTAADAAATKAAEVERENAELRASIADVKVRVARQEVLQEQHGKELERGLVRIEAAVVALHARLDNALSQRGERQS